MLTFAVSQSTANKIFNTKQRQLVMALITLQLPLVYTGFQTAITKKSLS